MKPPPPSPEVRAMNTIVWRKINNTDFLCSKNPYKTEHVRTEEQARMYELRNKIEQYELARELAAELGEVWE